MPTVTSQGTVTHRNPVDWIAGALVMIIGALNWGLVGAAQFDLVAAILGRRFTRCAHRLCAGGPRRYLHAGSSVRARARTSTYPSVSGLRGVLTLHPRKTPRRFWFAMHRGWRCNDRPAASHRRSSCPTRQRIIPTIPTTNVRRRPLEREADAALKKGDKEKIDRTLDDLHVSTTRQIRERISRRKRTPKGRTLRARISTSKATEHDSTWNGYH